MSEEIEVTNLVTKLSIDDTGVERSMAELTRQMKVVQSEFQAASSRLGEHASSQDALRTKADSLNKQMEIQAQKVAKLKQQHQEAVAAKGADARETQNLETKLNKATTQYNKMESELRKTTSELDKQTSAWNKAATALDAAAKKLEAVGQKMSQAGQSLTLMATVPLAAAGTAATKSSIDFETSWAGVTKTVNATTAELEGFKQEVRDMAKEMPATASEIASVTEAAGQLGIKNNALMGFTKTMTDLGVATNMSSEQAATSLARLANITQMPQQNFDKLGSTIVALGNNLATTESEITEMALRLAGAGHQIGLSEAQILSFAGSLSSVGIEAEAGGSAFSRVMIDMASAVMTNSKKLETFAAVAGMSAKQFKENWNKDASGVLITFIEGLGRMSKAGENTFGVLDRLGLSEIRVRDSLLRASGAGDLFRESLDLGTKAWADNSALAKEANTRYETTASKLKILGNRITDAAITLGDALVPALMAALDALEPLFKSIEEGSKWFASLDASSQTTIISILAMVAAAGPLLLITGKLVTSIAALIPVVKALGAALMFLTTNPIGLILTGIAAAVTAFMAIKNSMAEAKQAAEDLAQAQQDLQDVQQKGITRDEVDAAQAKIDKLNELVATYQKLIDIASASSAAQMGNNVGGLYFAADELGVKLKDVEKAAEEFGIQLEYIDDNGKISAKSMKDLQNAVNTYTKAIKDAKRETASEINDQAKSIATRKQELNSIDNLIKTYSTAKKGSKDWTAAQNELASQFPQFVTATGLNVEAIKGLLLVKEREIALEWANIQMKAQEALQEKNAAITKQQAAIAIAQSIAKITGASGLAEAALARMNGELERLKGEAASLQALAGMQVTDFKIPAMPKVPTVKLDTGGSKKAKTPKTPKAATYENKALDEAYKQLEHLKALDQLTSDQELKMLETIQAKYVKTADERMAIEEKIYAVKKQLGDTSLEKALKDYERSKQLGKLDEEQEIARLERIKKLYANSADERADLDDKIWEATQRKIEADKQKRIDAVQYTSQQLQAAYEDRVVREKLSDEEAFKLKDKLYNEQIYLNKNYLEKVLADEKYTAAEKKKIEREMTEEIRKQTNDRLQLQKEYAEAVKKAQIDSMNEMSKGIQDALKAKYQAEKQAAEDSVKAAQEANDTWKNNQLDAIKTVYNARVDAAQKAADEEIKRINDVYNAQIDAIQKQLDALDQAEKQKSRAEMDAEDEQKIKELRDNIEYSHDEYNKTQLQKELNKVIADMNERHRQEQLQDTKDALKSEQQELKDKLSEETQAAKDQLAAKKEIMAEEYQAQQDNINAIYAAQKLSLDQQLADTQAHYAKLLEAKNLQAEAEKMIISKQQDDILKLLNDFGDGYQQAGQTLGEKMVAGFRPKVDEISQMIASVVAQIDSARSAALQTMATAAAAASAANAAASKKDTSTSNNKPSDPLSGVVTETTGTVRVINNFNTPVTSPSDVAKATIKSAQQLAMQL
ncbi:phage tail tape measure protein [Paenibacillus dokdonensis]|uniref:Phage tail tape measure protein n=1 Tax=Paenibacillus dokdonensis TaxID=2567944 RepID=A0ABU6GSQ5_9BACL|nr:phage tail tape measure protein [Paenibacillus dokdonensis]MEC0242763.1 phage tail tape measure protein [Paenibacillus dokdonensis]